MKKFLLNQSYAVESHRRRRSFASKTCACSTDPSKPLPSFSLQNDKPGEFFDVTYPIPEELTRGKNKIAIRFEAQPGNIAGGFYGLRIIKHE